MGASKKRKAEKAKDFQKAKLRVGKTKAKPSNFTDTSFRSKAISVSHQSLSTVAPSTTYQFTHHLSLLTHASPTVRRESLSYLTTHYPTAHASAPSTATIIPKLAPLIFDPSNKVRTHLLALLKVLPQQEVRLHLPKLLLHIHSAMTHIDPDVRDSSSRFLSWALELGREETLRNGGWARGLTALAGALGFRTGAGKVLVPAGESKKIVVQHLETLRLFLEAGLDAPREGGAAETVAVSRPHWSSGMHMLPTTTGVYAYLGLWASGVREEEPEDLESRRRWMGAAGKELVGGMRLFLVSMRSEAGEVGRVAGRVLAAVDRNLIIAP